MAQTTQFNVKLKVEEKRDLSRLAKTLGVSLCGLAKISLQLDRDILEQTIQRLRNEDAANA